MATVIPGPLPCRDQHSGWRLLDGPGRLFAADPRDAQGGRESPKLEEDR